MRTPFMILGTALLCLVAAVSVAPAQEYSSVPTTVESISDTVLRDALAQYSPNYNYLVRGDQIRDYVNIFQVLYNSQPALTATDSALLATATAPTVVTTSPQVVYTQPPVYYAPPPVYYDSRPGFSFGISIGNDRWNRPGWNRPRPGHRPPSGGWNRPPSGGWNRPPAGRPPHGGGGSRPPHGGGGNRPPMRPQPR